MKKAFVMVLVILFIPLGGLFTAEITVPHLELASRGTVEDGDFGISTSAEADIALNGGYKYGITLGLGAEIPNLEKALSYGRLDMPYLNSTSPTGDDYNELARTVEDRFNNQATLSIRYLEAVVRDLFDKPLELAFFIGRYNKLGSGDDFQERFGTVQVGTGMRGFLYYPEGLGGDPSLRFNGAIHGILGTGLALKGLFLDKVVPSVYLYQDLSFKDPVTGTYLPGHYSGDFSLMVNGEIVKFEGFTGVTYINQGNPVLRGGLLAYVSSGSMGLLMQAGLPYWEAGKSITIDNFYFLLEPRLRFEKLGMGFTFFYHPVYYMNREILDENNDPDSGKADINLKVFYGDISRSTFEGGLETTLGMRMHNGEDMTLWISPFVRTVTSGLLWDFKVRVNVLYFTEGGDLMEGFIGIRTAY
ncbi:MAG: hypothetical protein LBK77_03525 [Spirochaetaceae bacterium]|jgi:hypothetical protein|nr:hypothetical protein [Spirochaetaceae bacterium]